MFFVPGQILKAEPSSDTPCHVTYRNYLIVVYFPLSLHIPHSNLAHPLSSKCGVSQTRVAGCKSPPTLALTISVCLSHNRTNKSIVLCQHKTTCKTDFDILPSLLSNASNVIVFFLFPSNTPNTQCYRFEEVSRTQF